MTWRDPKKYPSAPRGWRDPGNYPGPTTEWWPPPTVPARAATTPDTTPPPQWGSEQHVSEGGAVRLVDVAFPFPLSESIVVYCEEVRTDLNIPSGEVSFKLIFGTGGTRRIVSVLPGRHVIACETVQVDAERISSGTGLQVRVKAFAARNRSPVTV